MSSEWPIVALSDCADFLTGFPFKSSGYSKQESDIRLLRGDNVIQGVIRWDSAKRWPASDASSYGSYFLRPHDIVLAMDRPWIEAGLKLSAVSAIDVPALLVQRVTRIRSRGSVDPRYLFSVLRGPEFTDYVQSITTGTAVPHISLQQIKNFRLRLPNLAVQAAAGAVLAALDDRITLLRETNVTLEAIAQALFKSWFIDFDPVHAKAAGRAPEGMDEETAALFPDGFEESELGSIPRGWQCVRLEDVLELAYGKALTADCRRPGSVPVYGSGGITGYHDEPLVREASVIVGRKGTVGSLYWEDGPFHPIDTTFYVLPKSAPLTYCFLALKRLRLDTMNTDAAVPGLNRQNAYQLRLVRPDNRAMRAFDGLVVALKAKIASATKSARLLTELRDTLLPRLISGKLRMQEAQEQVEDALA